jgi:competence protein ComEC
VRLALAVLVALAACRPAPIPPILRPPNAPEPRITWRRVETAAAMPPAPSPGHYQVHLIDVGTGLAILVRGADFALLYDAGTNDRDERPRRVVDYLTVALGPSGDELCGDVPAAERRALDHVVLSHPHLDHASALDLVLHCFDVATFWDSGRSNDTVFYRELLAGISRTPRTRYRTAADVPVDRARRVRDLDVTLPDWQRFSDGDVVELGAGARFTILHADGKQQRDANQNSIVIAVELGAARLLLVGDAESGPRRDPTYPPGDIEAYLIDHHARAIRADILQVGHHGSKTSSRRAFLEAVHPALALLSTGPKRYGRVTLPDREVLDELRRLRTTVLRTDERDGACPIHGRIGGDRGPGGCDSWVIEIGP